LKTDIFKVVILYITFLATIKNDFGILYTENFMCIYIFVTEHERVKCVTVKIRKEVNRHNLQANETGSEWGY